MTEVDVSKIKDYKTLRFTYTPELKEKAKMMGMNIERELRKQAELVLKMEADKHNFDPKDVTIVIEEVTEDELPNEQV